MLHFAFADGAVGYDCVACGSRCCKGFGFALGGDELVPLVARAPALAPFMQLVRSTVHVLDVEDGCWELGADERCGLEVRHGRAAKPSTCRLFPVNRLLRVADGTIIVDLQLTHCPLVDARTQPRTVIHWADVARDLDEVGDGAIVIDARPPPGTPDDWIARELEARDGAATAPLTCDAQAEWRRFFAVDDAEAARLEAAVLPLYRLALPSLRLNLLTLPGAPPYPKLMRGMDAQLAAGAWLAMLSARAGRAPSLRGIAELWRGLPLVRDILARWHERVTLAGGVAPPSAPPELAAAWTELYRRAGHTAIGEALQTSSLSPSLRPLLLRLASDRLR